ncbi:MAG: hypothetical protein M1821_001636 [Bathelium mastoideum]|nr:MAG: hypothetical protein M1821_001636 [Bathelium mastoideum]
MADPISIFGLVVEIGDILWKVYEYGKKVKEWKGEVRVLCEELYALKGVLEHFQQRSDSSKDKDDQIDGVIQFMQSSEFSNMIRSTKEFLDDLLLRLTIPSDKLRKTVKALAWPLNKNEISDHVKRVGRAKTWFVMTMMSDNLDLSRETYREVRELKTLLHQDRESRTLERQEKVRKDLVDWLAPVSPKDAHTKAYIKCQVGTGSWFVKGAFEEWFCSNSPRTLWLRGKSGAGKTTLFSNVVEQALQRTHVDPECNVLFFYCSYDRAASQDPVNVLASLVVQLAERFPGLLDGYEENYRRRNPPAIQELEERILNHSAEVEYLYIFIDAVNESSSSNNLIASLSRITRAENVRILVTSTPDVDAQEMQHDQMSVVDMQRQWIENDIELFVMAKIQESPHLGSLSEAIKLEIKETVIGKADGMYGFHDFLPYSFSLILTFARFRWVKCQMDFLAVQRTGKAVKKALEQLPDDINSVYTRILTSIYPADQAMAKQAFMWLSFSQRPLSLLELCEAVVIDEDDCSINDDCRLHHETVLLRMCKGLIVYNEEVDEVALAHSSVRAFLTSTKIKDTEASFFAFDHQEASRMILRKCLTYLMFDDFNIGCQDRDNLFFRYQIFHLLEYAALHWAVHADQGAKPAYSIEETDHLLISEFLSTYNRPTGGNFTHWVLCLIEDIDDNVIRATEPLYYMCSFGLTPVVERLVQKNPRLQIDAPGGRLQSTALQVSCVRGPIEIVRFLLEHGADPNSCNMEGLSCLFWAIRYNRKDVYQLLMQYGAEPTDYLERRGPQRRSLYTLAKFMTIREARNLILESVESGELDDATTSPIAQPLENGSQDKEE